jgi:hypothetical protein
MSVNDIICQAINEKKLLKFSYEGMERIVEPHQLAFNEENNLALNAYWVRGYSKSGNTFDRWREYLVHLMTSVVILNEKFSEPRAGYRRTPNEKYHSAICQL